MDALQTLEDFAEFRDSLQNTEQVMDATYWVCDSRQKDQKTYHHYVSSSFLIILVRLFDGSSQTRVSEVFSVNQHASICGGFGPCPDTAYAYTQWDAKRRNSVTGAAQLQSAAVLPFSDRRYRVLPTVRESAQGDLPIMRL